MAVAGDIPGNLGMASAMLVCLAAVKRPMGGATANRLVRSSIPNAKVAFMPSVPTSAVQFVRPACKTLACPAKSKRATYVQPMVKLQHFYPYLPGIITLLGIMGGVSCFTSQPGVAQEISPQVMNQIRNSCASEHVSQSQEYFDCVNQYQQRQLECLTYPAEYLAFPQIQSYCQPPPLRSGKPQSAGQPPVGQQQGGQPSATDPTQSSERAGSDPATADEDCTFGEECP